MQRRAPAQAQRPTFSPLLPIFFVQADEELLLLEGIDIFGERPVREWPRSGGTAWTRRQDV